MIEWLKARFGYAFQGILLGLREDRSIQLQVLLGLVTLAVCYFFHIRKDEWLIILLCIALVIVTEMVNSAIEECVDYISLDPDPRAKRIKDLAAGAVLVSSLFAALIGAIILFPYVSNYFF